MSLDPVISSDVNRSEQGEPVTDWDAIKKQEKAGKEWMEAYLPGALEEAEKLLERAEERKGIKK